MQATTGDQKLGGRNLDELLVEVIALRIEEERSVDVTHDRQVLHKIRTICEGIKKQFLGEVDEVTFRLETQTMYDQTELEEYETVVTLDDF